MLRRTDVQWNHNTVYNNLWNDQSKVSLYDEDKIAIQIVINCSGKSCPEEDAQESLGISFRHIETKYEK